MEKRIKVNLSEPVNEIKGGVKFIYKDRPDTPLENGDATDK